MEKKIWKVKILCGIAIIITILINCYVLYKNLMKYHNDNILIYHSQIEATADEEIKKAVFLSGKDVDIYKLRGLIAYYQNYENGTLILKMLNYNNLDISLLGLRNEDGTIYHQFDENDLVHQLNGIYEFIEYSIKDVDEKILTEINSIYLDYMYDNLEKKSVKIIPFPFDNESILEETEIPTRDNLSDFDFVEIDNETITFVGKEIAISKPMFIPEGYTLLIQAGQIIDFVNESFLVSYSPVNLIGNQTAEIVFLTSDNTGRGFFVCQSNGPSIMEYTRFEGLNTPNSGIWELTGSVTFYESDIIIRNCTFTGNTCEDGLNIVRSEFEINNSLFQNTFADAFDSDFSNGQINDCTFSNTGNDALDISTSVVDMSNVVFKDIGDKAISGGEKSKLKFCDVDISNSVIGIASKDMSEIFGENVHISDTMIGMTLYQKKPEFGSAYIDVNEVEFSGEISIDYLIEANSILTVNGTQILPRSETKESILFNKMINGEPLQ